MPIAWPSTIRTLVLSPGRGLLAVRRRVVALKQRVRRWVRRATHW